jgi:hypothetical protein
MTAITTRATRATALTARNATAYPWSDAVRAGIRNRARSAGKLFGCSPVCSAACSASLSLFSCCADALGVALLAMPLASSLT